MSTPAMEFSRLASKVLFEVTSSLLDCFNSLKPQFSAMTRNIRLAAPSHRHEYGLWSTDSQVLCRIALALLPFIVWAVCASAWRKTKSSKQVLPRDPRLSALDAFIIPTQSTRQDARLVSFNRDVSMSIELSDLIGGIYSGSIELRNPLDLQALFQDQLHVGKCKISLRVDSRWRMRILKWVVASYSDARKAYPRSSNKYRDQQTLFLDSIPQSDIEDALSKFLVRLPSGNRAKVVFTARNPHIRFMSKSFLYCAIPFVSNDKAATSLSASLDYVVSRVSRAPGVRILSVTNVSAGYAMSLYEAENELVDDSDTRTRFIEHRGEEAWRKERLLLVWEAGLYASGLLDRWVVVVER
ncbi:hypothetical protein V5O48_000924 [Marasmius crinis-equi]|uniref:Uncharacterized protein n=1 Tax=Marasmius crinis-equi TaxID=585013 RepID=A0ABR3G026_9AGAR